MIVVDDYPPNIDAISAVFPAARRKGVLFTYGETVYAPGRTAISHALDAHESVHSRRQGKTEQSINYWWGEYLSNVEFRFYEELLAHQAEYKWFNQHIKDRNQLAKALHTIAVRLSSDLYGSVINYSNARAAVMGNRYILKDT